MEQLNESPVIDTVSESIFMLVRALEQKKPVLVCGNGGSASDAQHIAGELVGRFLLERPALNVLALSSNSSVLTAWSNDYDYDTVFSRQVEAHGQEGGILWGISTSGNSMNVLNAMRAAKALNMGVLGLTGEGGGKMGAACDVLMDVPSRSTPRIQEMHLVLYHFICERVEAELAG